MPFTQENIDEMDLNEALDSFMSQEDLHRTEGRRGVIALCTLARGLGYKDPQYFGQLTSKAALGDLICFLEDNPGAVLSITEWIGNQRSPEWLETLKEQLNVEEPEHDGQPDEAQEWQDFDPEC